MVRNRRYALDRDALPWMMKGVRCSHIARQCKTVMLVLWLAGYGCNSADHADLWVGQGFSAWALCTCKQAARP